MYEQVREAGVKCAIAQYTYLTKHRKKPTVNKKKGKRVKSVKRLGN